MKIEEKQFRKIFGSFQIRKNLKEKKMIRYLKSGLLGGNHLLSFM